MKKIGIATITCTKGDKASFNYGNILQNYALSCYIQKKFKVDVETIYYSSTVPEYTLKKKDTGANKKEISQFMDDSIRVLKRNIYSKRLHNKVESRNRKFTTFINNNIQYSQKKYSGNSNFSELDNIYDAVITGSDQVWNPYYEGSNPFYYLDYIKSGKRISYAPSIGVVDVPVEIDEKFGQWITQIDYISIREAQGKKLLKEKYNIDSKLVCDPVFLLSEEEWKMIQKKPNNLPDKYFVVYILGKKTVQTKKYIKAVERRFNVKAIDIFSRDDITSEFCGPDEFVGIISNSEFVLTDSFHGSAFATIFKKSLIIVDRNAGNKSSTYKMNSRIDNLLNLINAGNRSVERLIEYPEELEMNYENINSFEHNIIESKEFLCKAISECI